MSARRKTANPANATQMPVTLMVTDEVRDIGVFADANLPRKFTEDEIGIGIASLKMFVGFSEIIGGGTGAIEEGAVHGGQRLANTDVVPVSVVFAEVANALVRIE